MEWIGGGTVRVEAYYRAQCLSVIGIGIGIGISNRNQGLRIED